MPQTLFHKWSNGNTSLNILVVSVAVGVILSFITIEVIDSIYMDRGFLTIALLALAYSSAASLVIGITWLFFNLRNYDVGRVLAGTIGTILLLLSGAALGVLLILERLEGDAVFWALTVWADILFGSYALIFWPLAPWMMKHIPMRQKVKSAAHIADQAPKSA